MTHRLPTICRWIFAFLTGASLLAVAVTIAVMIINPTIDSVLKGGTYVELKMPPDMLLLNKKGAVVSITGLRADITDKDEHGLVILLKRFGLPLALVSTVFAAILFDLFRRLFRNVERGKSFAPETIALMRGIGFSLLGYSLVSNVAGSILLIASRDYFRSHSALLGPGVIWNNHLPLGISFNFSSSGFSFIGSIFFAGILVLALSEVFRQGLSLKSDNDLTI